MGPRVGEFTLGREIGKGGMGRVWSGRHVRLGTPVAIKVLHPTKDVRSGDALRNEIRSMARLDHPAIAWIYDFGVVSSAEAVETKSGVQEGAPWIAMELASGGSLVDIPRLMGWAELRPFLFRLLDALAHAHARDLIHRDLKPANILIGAAGDIRPGIKLADFGIAQALDEFSRGAARPVGTPHYMAPEQVLGAYRRQGPWTDLYSLGCVSWLLTTGKRPFTGLQGGQLAQAQLTRPPPPFRPVVNVPEGFDDWLYCLLQKHPRDRYRCAADAAWALKQLADAPEEQSEPLELPGLPSLPPPFDEPFDPDEDTEIAEVTQEALVTERVLALHAPRVAEVPYTWRLSLPDHTPRRASRALWGLRPIGVVGRESERDRLWDALAQVRRTGRASVVWIRGGSGVGKTHLGEWLVHRALEVGAAEVIRAEFEEGEAADAGLSRAWNRAFHITGMDETLGDKLVSRTLRDLGAQDAVLLAVAVQVLRPDAQVDAGSRYTLMNMLLALFCRQRTHIVFLDDLQWGLDGVRWVRALLASQGRRPLPVLVVGTLQEEGLAERPSLAREIQKLEAIAIELGPLSSTHQTELVQRLLGLDRSLTAKVVEQTAGNPMFAVQLVGHWVDSGTLQPGEAGLTLSGEPDTLPPTVRSVVSTRVERLLDGLPPDAGAILEVAAVLGPVVESVEWEMAVDDPERGGRRLGSQAFWPARARIRHVLEERLIAARLAEETETGFQFTHPVIVAVLRDRASREGRLKRHAAVAASVTRALGVDAGRFERLGRFLLEAGMPEKAVEPLLEGARVRRRRLGSQSALAMVDRCIEAAAVLDSDDSRRIEATLVRASILHDLGDGDAAVRALESVEPRITDPVQRAEALVCRAQIARDLGDFAGCESTSLEAIAALEDKKDAALLGRAWWMATLAAVDSGRPERVRERAALATASLQRSGDEHSRAEALRMMAYVEVEEGRYEAALALSTDALERYRRMGSIRGTARSLLSLGRCLVSLGRELGRAERVLDESLGLFEAWSQPATFQVKVAIAFLHNIKGDPAAAYALVAPIVRDRESQGERFASRRAWVAMVEACAGLGLWAEFDHALDEVERHLGGARFFSNDAIRSFERSAIWAQKAEHPLRGARVELMAEAQRAATQASTKRV